MPKIKIEKESLKDCIEQFTQYINSIGSELKIGRLWITIIFDRPKLCEWFKKNNIKLSGGCAQDQETVDYFFIMEGFKHYQGGK